eukprot:CAMPEP_0113259644 /NCGR_PEP_ID=MMETSP0008_2-20120614/16461_1 /TAXON_ID=97485 /ORGANISM="Prymnesium parvum" /LENGTH=105 /DNA_ID=CAMNT_0000108175 /DNA_START=608 /DNA_END=925 /DNA_ORIENTATION=- /assembly_acc=CAM_ASM_000153
MPVSAPPPITFSSNSLRDMRSGTLGSGSSPSMSLTPSRTTIESISGGCIESSSLKPGGFVKSTFSLFPPLRVDLLTAEVPLVAGLAASDTAMRGACWYAGSLSGA